MHLETDAIVVAVRAHGEHGAIVRALTPGEGVQAGYVRGGRSRRLKPMLVPGNLLHAEYRARTEEQLAHLTVELVHSRAFLLSEPLAAAGLEWACALTASAVPEGQPYPHLFEALEGLLGAIEAAPSARGWSAALIRYELIVLAELGFGLAPERIAALPPRLAGPAPGWDDIVDGLRLTGRHLERDLLTGRQSEILAARERLIARLKRVGG
ncbi:DNA repair protein RecO [Sphingosinicella sp. CPCC 101087]|uniref:DNA repair protein RecO n=1 Tax=Sphingosinicella sp. CPCC 101087 TaxID=2497754 RepID=UPI00101B93BC|nr:DNA repair protein RecO [Sphingosinicella sp. CPCC 101087]